MCRLNAGPTGGRDQWSYWRLWTSLWMDIQLLDRPDPHLDLCRRADSLFSLLYAVVIVVTTMISGLDVPGYASLITAFCSWAAFS